MFPSVPDVVFPNEPAHRHAQRCRSCYDDTEEEIVCERGHRLTPLFHTSSHGDKPIPSGAPVPGIGKSTSGDIAGPVAVEGEEAAGGGEAAEGEEPAGGGEAAEGAEVAGGGKAAGGGAIASRPTPVSAAGTSGAGALVPDRSLSPRPTDLSDCNLVEGAIRGS